MNYNKMKIEPEHIHKDYCEECNTYLRVHGLTWFRGRRICYNCLLSNSTTIPSNFPERALQWLKSRRRGKE